MELREAYISQETPGERISLRKEKENIYIPIEAKGLWACSASGGGPCRSTAHLMSEPCLTEDALDQKARIHFCECLPARLQDSANHIQCICSS